jgi:16S rRNA (guanine527-N7)-methyltransferase
MSILEDRAREYGVRLAESQLAQIDTYLTLLEDWSARMNLVGDASRDVVIERHVLESIALGAALREREIIRPDADVLDIGAGAGFPGLVLKIVWPAIRLTLLEATAKKTRFLAAAIEAAEIDAIVLTGRAEDLGHDSALRDRFDLVTARAVAPLRTLAELALPFARVGGRVVTPKGSRAQSDLFEAANALRVLGGRAFAVPFRVPGPPQTLIAIVKDRTTPPEYPRRPGVPARSPL